MMNNDTKHKTQIAKVSTIRGYIRFAVEISPESHELLAREHARNGGSIGEALERLISRGSLSAFALESLNDSLRRNARF